MVCFDIENIEKLFVILYKKLKFNILLKVFYYVKTGILSKI